MPLLEEAGFNSYHTKPLAIDDELDVLAGITDLAISSDKIEKVIKKGTGKASISYFPSEDIGLLAKSDTGDETFKIVIGGVDVGDVIMGDYAGGAGAKWDESTGIFDVKGTIAASTIDIGGSDASSFHVDIDGNLWLGASTFAASPAKISNTGEATFTNVTATNIGAAFFGDGSDGDVTISANTSLTRDMYYNNLTIANGYTLSPSGYRIFVKGTLTVNSTGVISGNGNNANDAVGYTHGNGGASLADGTLRGSVAGGNGGDGSLGGGTPPTTPPAPSAVTSSLTANVGSTGGNGGDGSIANGTDGAVGGAVTQSKYRPTDVNNAFLLIEFFNGAVPVFEIAGGTSGGGGGGGRGGGSAAGGGGGGAGSNGRVIGIFAQTIINNGTIQSLGGEGGDGYGGQANEGDGGGGAGGNGGYISIICRTYTGNNPAVTGGAKGVTTSLGGVGIAGTDGVVGSTGTYKILYI